jgi:hypothetical protein
MIRIARVDVRHQSIIPVPDMMSALGAEFPHEGFGVRGNYRGPAFRTYDFEFDHGSHFFYIGSRKYFLKVFASEATSISTIRNLEIASSLAFLGQKGRMPCITVQSARNLVP